MINLPPKFEEYLNKDESEPCIVVEVGKSIIENYQTTQGDWENNSDESDVDYATLPGNVILAADTIPQQANATENNNLYLFTVTAGFLGFIYRYGIQSFQQSTLSSKNLGIVAFSVEAFVYSDYVKVSCFVREGSKTGPIVTTTKTNTISSTTTAYTLFNFTSENVEIKAGVTYYAFIYSSDPGFFANYVILQYDDTGGYADGQLDSQDWQSDPPVANEDNIGDAKFYVTFYGDYYQTIGYITTQIIDLGETPATNGEWVFNEIEPTLTGYTVVQYTCYGSTDGFVASDVTIGVKEDGDSIGSGDWYRYYKIKAFLITTDASVSPIVNDVGLSFVSYDYYSDRDVFGFEPGLEKISSLTTSIDDFDLTTIGQMSITLAFTETLSSYLSTIYYKGKPVKIKLGFVGSDFTYNDFILFYFGKITSCKISSGHWVNITIQDDAASWKIDIPRDETVVAGEYVAGTFTDIVASADHPIDVMLDIMQNQLNVRDSQIDLGTFESVKTTLSGWEVTRTIDSDNSESADVLLNELRILTSTYFLPDPYGKIKLKRFDSTESAVESFTDDDFLNPPDYDSNLESLINKTFIEFDYNTGTDAYDHVYIGIDTTSIANYNETNTFSIQDKWTLTADVAQISAMNGIIIARYADPPPKITVNVDYKKLIYEVGDFITLTTFNAPSSDFTGISAVKYQIINKNIDIQRFKIKLILLRV